MIGCLFYVLSIFPATDKDQILNVLNHQEKCWNNGDIDCFMKGYWKSKELMFIGQNGITYGWDSTLKNYKLRYPTAESRGKLSFDIVNVSRISDDVYLVVGKYHLIRNIGNISGHFTLTFRKINKEWKIVADHTCADR